MARTAKPIKTVKPAATGRKQARSAGTAAKPDIKSGRTKTSATPVLPSKRVAASPASSGQVSKGELRAQIEKLEQTNAKLRAKNREAGRDAKLSAARIAELEAQVARLEKQLKPKAAPVTSRAKSTKARSPEQGDALPPGVAVEEPAALGQEAEQPRDHE